MLEINDVFGEKVKLSGDSWKDIVKKHPEVESLESAISLTLSHPEVVTKSIYNDKVSLYYRFLPNIFKGKLLVVVVKRLTQHEKYIATVYITDKRKAGEIIWPIR